MFKHLFVPVDGTELSKRAMDCSIELAKQLGARITAFVAEPDINITTVNPDPQIFTERMRNHEAQNAAHAKTLLKHFENRAQAAGVPFAGRFQSTDGIDAAIVSEAEQAGCDIIVMVTHGRGPVGEFIFGSHAKRTISMTKLPVLVLH